MGKSKTYTLAQFADMIGVHYFTALGMVKRGNVRSLREKGRREHVIPACEVSRVKRARNTGTIRKFRQDLSDFVLSPSDVTCNELGVEASELGEFIAARLGYDVSNLIDCSTRLNLLRSAIAREVKRIHDAQVEIETLEA